MRIQLFSDVHTEFHRDGGAGFLKALDPEGVDVLVVAGDLTSPRRLRDTLAALCALYPEVVYVTGNHEYYGTDRDTLHGALDRVAGARANLHWLESGAVTLGDRRFVGSALWFPDLPDGRNAELSGWLTDFRLIRGFEEWVYRVNAESRAYLEATVGPGDIVVTHHIPHPAGVAPLFRGPKYADLNRFFLCDMTALIEQARPALWCFGHTHAAVDTAVGPTRLLCNPLGYPHEPAWGYRDRLVVDV